MTALSDTRLTDPVATMSPARRRSCHMRPKTSLPSLPESVPCSTSSTSSASAAGGTGTWVSMSLRASSTRPSTSLMSQLASFFGCAGATATARSK